MIEYIKKKAKKSNTSTLRYVGAFADGIKQVQNEYYRSADACPKLLQAYRDGRRYKKRFDSKSSN